MQVAGPVEFQILSRKALITQYAWPPSQRSAQVQELRDLYRAKGFPSEVLHYKMTCRQFAAGSFCQAYFSSCKLNTIFSSMWPEFSLVNLSHVFLRDSIFLWRWQRPFSTGPSSSPRTNQAEGLDGSASPSTTPDLSTAPSATQTTVRRR